MNDLTFTQISTILNSIVSQATGQTTITPTDTSSFVAVAQTGLKVGYDNLMNAVSQVLAKTIFSIRPYKAKFSELEMTNFQFGNAVRKLQVADNTFVDDDRLPLADGQTVDMYKVRKPIVIQTNFYGQSAYEDYWTTFRDQLDVAFSSPDEFSRFISMYVQNNADRRAQARENLSRSTVANLIGGTISASSTDSSRIVHLIAEYNAITGLTLSKTNYQSPEYYTDFIRWVYARVMSISDLMTERSELFHSTIDGKHLMRHTPKNMQKMYILSPIKHDIQARVLSQTFNKNELNGLDGELVNYWQSIEEGKRDAINITPSIMNTDGSVSKGEAISESGIFGIIFDKEAAGVNHFNEWAAVTPFNARGGYYNTFFHATDRYFNDFTENSVVLKLD